MLFLPDADYETDPWGGSVASDSQLPDRVSVDLRATKGFSLVGPGTMSELQAMPEAVDLGRGLHPRARRATWHLLQ